MPAPGAPTRIGELLGGKYRLEKLLGAGGMGEVYRAEHTLIGRTVAIKTLRTELASNHEVVTRFLREARAANLVRHPNVVDVLDIGQDDNGAPFIVQEFLQGTDLARHLEDLGGRLPPDAVLQMLMPVIEAISVAHAKGVVHRDLKPENVFLAREGNTFVPKVLDFGISKIASTPNELRMTSADAAMGTPAYMSPEQVRGARNVDARTDVWALGVMLHELLAGDLPFTGETQGAVFLQICTREPPSLIEVAPHVSSAVAAIVARCLKKDVTERYANASELVRELRAAVGAPSIARPGGALPESSTGGGVGNAPSSPRTQPLLSLGELPSFNDPSLPPHPPAYPPARPASRSNPAPPLDAPEGYISTRDSFPSGEEDFGIGNGSDHKSPMPPRQISRADYGVVGTGAAPRARAEAEGPNDLHGSLPPGFTESTTIRRAPSGTSLAAASMFPQPVSATQTMRTTAIPPPATGSDTPDPIRTIVSLAVLVTFAVLAFNSPGWSVLTWSGEMFATRPVSMLGVSAFLTVVLAAAFIAQGFRRDSVSPGLVAAGVGFLGFTGYLTWAASNGGWPATSGAVTGPLVVLPWLLALVPGGLAAHAFTVVGERSSDGRAQASPWESTLLVAAAFAGVFCVVQVLHGTSLPVTTPVAEGTPVDNTLVNSTTGDDGLIHRAHATGR